jgi:WD40 repeat protein
MTRKLFRSICRMTALVALGVIALLSYTRQAFADTCKSISVPVNHIKLSPNGKFVLSNWENGAALWNFETGQQIYTFVEQNNSNDNYILHSANSVDFSPNGDSVLIAIHDHITLWDMKSGKLLKTFIQDI